MSFKNFNFYTPNTTTNKILFITCFAFLLFFLEYTFRNHITEISNKVLKHLIKRGDNSHCDLFSNFQFFEYSGRFLLLFIILNFTNTFAALSFVLLDSFTIFLNGCLKMIYLEPRPYWIDEELFPCICAQNYGNPSTTGMNQFIIFAVVYKAFVTTYTNINKLYTAFLCFVPVLLIYSSRFFQGIHSINQLAFGGGIGFIVYYIYFEIMEINLESKKMLMKLVNNFIKISLFFILLFIISTVYHIITTFEENQEWIDIIVQYCEINPFNIFENESYRKTARLFFFIGCLLGCLLEYKFNYNNDDRRFGNYNCDKNFKFSNTDLKLTIYRTILMFTIYWILNYFLLGGIGDPQTDSFAYLTFMGFIVPYLIIGVLVFFFFKILCRSLGLTNEKLFELDINDDMLTMNSNELVEPLITKTDEEKGNDNNPPVITYCSDSDSDESQQNVKK